MSNPTERFSSRVEDYIKYRPGYPSAIIATLAANHGLHPASIVADLGSGPGQLTRLFLDYGCTVYGVEPNRDMREAGERLLAAYPHFSSVAGSAETTTLPDASVDWIVAGQAAHWFDRGRSRAEFARILRPDGWLVLVWNERRMEDTPFQQAYEALLQTYNTDYNEVRHKHVGESVEAFFAPGTCQIYTFDNAQTFDYSGLLGRLRSSSYTPEPGHPAYEPMLTALEQLFANHQHNGQVTFEMTTRVYVGRVTSDK
jgi:SAM-dependent methyltransferase